MAGASDPPAVRDPGLQPERTALAWRRTIMSAVVADVLIWRAWLAELAAPENATHLAALGVCAVVACLTTIVLVLCAVPRIRLLHAGVGGLAGSSRLAVSALTIRSATAAIVALALTAMGALVLEL